MLCKRPTLNPYIDDPTAEFNAEFDAGGAISLRQAARLLPPRGSKEHIPDGGKPARKARRTHRDGKHTGRGGNSAERELAKRLSYHSIWRAVRDGFEGVFLEAGWAPGGYFTTAPAVRRFLKRAHRGREMQARSKAAGVQPAPQPATRPTTSREQQYAATALDREFGIH